MVKFMVLGGPRSGTTWAANWLSTDHTHCLHDPLAEYTVQNLENLTVPGRRIGISCTMSMLYPEWVLKHPAPKVLLYRDVEEINESLNALGLKPWDVQAHYKRMMMYSDAGIPLFNWKALFEVKTALNIWNILLPDIPFDVYRHHLLVGMNVQPQFNKLPIEKTALTDFVQRCKDVLQ